MSNDIEIDRIKKTYERRSERVSSQLYSFFNISNLYTIQGRERNLLRIMKSNSIKPLEDNKILDIGCGMGGELRNMVKYGARPENLYGTDLIESRIKKAIELAPNINFTCTDATSIDHEDNTFDIVMQFTVFSSILDMKMKQMVAQEMLRVLKPDGIIIWYDFHMNNPSNRDVRGVKRAEVEDLFPGCQIRLKRITLAPPITRIIAPISIVLASMLENLKVLNTHYLGSISK